MKVERVIRYIQVSGVLLFYAFVVAVMAFLINGVRNGWQYRITSAEYEMSFSFSVIISSVVIIVFSVLTYVVSLIFWGILRERGDLTEPKGGDE